MGLETATYIAGLNSANPLSSDPSGQGDDHIRLIKAVIKATFPNLDAAVSRTPVQMNFPVPVGMIMAWGSDTIPSGWALCNGQTVTRSDTGVDMVLPDLRGKSLIGTPSGGTTGATGGADTATTAAGGAHNHGGTSGNGGSHTHTVGSGGSHSHAGTTNNDGGHTHTVGGGGAHDHGGNTGYVTLTESMIPAHDHLILVDGTVDSGSFLDPDDTHGVYAGATFAFSDSNYRMRRSGTIRGNVGLSSRTGGGNAHRHTIANEGNHTHSLGNSGSHNHTVSTDTAASHTHSLSSSADHNHSIATQVAHSHTVDTRSAFMHMNWVMKV